MEEKLSFGERIRHGWNAFINPNQQLKWDYGYASYFKPDRVRTTMGNEKSIVTAVYNRIALDVAMLDIRHVRLDDNEERFKEVINDSLNKRFYLMANKDQTARSFIQDAVMSMFDEGCIAIVPVDTNINPINTGSYDIESFRVGKIKQWYPDYVKLDIYNDKTGKHQETTLPKKVVAIIENPFYAVMNEPNSIAKRLIRKLNILDAIDEQSSSGKLDLIIQLPYVIKTDARRKQADDRRKDIENQLNGSKYGIAYTDGTEKITQLNRPVENNLMNQITFLTSMLYSQLGISEEIMNGKADEQQRLNYFNNTVVPCVNALVDGIKCKFLTNTAISQHQSVKWFRDPFSNTTIDKIAEMVDKFTRNEVASSNEMRSVLGWKPVDDPRADELRNKNLNAEAGVDPIMADQMEGGGFTGPEEDFGKMRLSELTGGAGKEEA